MNIFQYDYADKQWWIKQSLLQRLSLCAAKGVTGKPMATRLPPKKIPAFMNTIPVEENIPAILRVQAS